MICERARTITINDATILATTLQTGPVGSLTLYEPTGVSTTAFNAATTDIAIRNT